MPLRRRDLLRAGAGWVAAGALAGALPRRARAQAAWSPERRACEAALAAAARLGAGYADARVVRSRAERLDAREDHLVGLSSRERVGIGVRVLVGGAWGFAAAPRLDEATAALVAGRAVELGRAAAAARRARPVALAPTPAREDAWRTPLARDPLKIPLRTKAELLLAINAAALAVPGARFCRSSFEAATDWKLLVSSEGARIEQELTRVAPDYTVTAIDPRSGEFQTRSQDVAPAQAGWEYVEAARLVEDAPAMAREAVAKLGAASVTPGRRDLILDPTNLWLTIHESVGHPTELDRALGFEANFAGTSFATPDRLGKLRYASELVTLYADRTTPRGLATCAYDDDGVPTGRWDLVRRGLFVGYQTTRDQAAWIGEPTSRGCSFAESFADLPFQRMPNVSLAPGPRELSVEDLIAATDDGVYVVGRGSWSIDHQRYNFQFTGQTFWEIKRGRRTRPLRDVGYQANSLAFWNACDLLGGPASFRLGGALNDGKGEPTQSNAVSHGCPPARFRGIDVINTRPGRRA